LNNATDQFREGAAQMALKTIVFGLALVCVR